MAWKLYCDYTEPSDGLDALLAMAKRKGVHHVDTTSWTTRERDALYYQTLMPISVVKRKRLRGRLRTHKAGTVFFFQGVLVTEDDFYIGDEACAILDRLPDVPGVAVQATMDGV